MRAPSPDRFAGQVSLVKNRANKEATLVTENSAFRAEFHLGNGIMARRQAGWV
jgi:hypothetical protein